MKKWIPTLLFAALLSGCSSDYLITTTDGQMLTSSGKPTLDDETGMIEFEDSDGQHQQIPQTSVKQMIER